MRIDVTTVYVDDQAKALKFYTEILGFVKKKDVPTGGPARLLTVISPDGHDDVELNLEPNDYPAFRQFQASNYKEGLSAATFAVDDVEAEYQRLKTLGVKFTREPTKEEWGSYAIFDDTCGNLIGIHNWEGLE